MLYYLVATAVKQLRSGGARGYVFSLTMDKPTFKEAIDSVNESARLQGWVNVCINSVVLLENLDTGTYLASYKISEIGNEKVELEDGKAFMVYENSSSSFRLDPSSGHVALHIDTSKFSNIRTICSDLEELFRKTQLPTGYDCLITNLVKIE